MSQALPGDILIEPGWQTAAHGYAGIVVDHGRIVSNTSQGVRDDTSLLEIQRHHPEMAAFRYVGFWNFYRSKPLANAGFNTDEPPIPAGQPGGGQWTSGGSGGMQMAPSTTLLSGGNRWTPGEKAPDMSAFDAVADYLADVAEVWKGYGDAITETITGLWNAAWHPIDTAKEVATGAAQIVKDPVGALKAIGKQIAAVFTSGDLRKAGKLIGQALIALAGTELPSETLATFLPKVEAAAAGEQVTLTAEEAGILQEALKGPLGNLVDFEGLEVRGVRDISHLDMKTLEEMQKYGFAPTTKNGSRIVIHHMNQNAAGPLVEMPQENHNIWNAAQHPLRNRRGSGLSDAERAAFNKWRTDYWKWRATQELNRRRILGE